MVITTFKVGDRVKVAMGQLAGRPGTVVEVDESEKTTRYVVEVDGGDYSFRRCDLKPVASQEGEIVL